MSGIGFERVTLGGTSRAFFLFFDGFGIKTFAGGAFEKSCTTSAYSVFLTFRETMLYPLSSPNVRRFCSSSLVNVMGVGPLPGDLYACFWHLVPATQRPFLALNTSKFLDSPFSVFSTNVKYASSDANVMSFHFASCFQYIKMDPFSVHRAPSSVSALHRGSLGFIAPFFCRLRFGGMVKWIDIVM